MDLFEISDDFSIVEWRVPAEWAGNSLVQLNLREKMNLNVIGIKRGDEVTVNVDPSETLNAGEILIVIGNNEDLSHIRG